MSGGRDAANYWLCLEGLFIASAAIFNIEDTNLHSALVILAACFTLVHKTAAYFGVSFAACVTRYPRHRRSPHPKNANLFACAGGLLHVCAMGGMVAFVLTRVASQAAAIIFTVFLPGFLYTNGPPA